MHSVTKDNTTTGNGWLIITRYHGTHKKCIFLICIPARISNILTIPGESASVENHTQTLLNRIVRIQNMLIVNTDN